MVSWFLITNVITQKGQKQKRKVNVLFFCLRPQNPSFQTQFLFCGKMLAFQSYGIWLRLRYKIINHEVWLRKLESLHTGITYVDQVFFIRFAYITSSQIFESANSQFVRGRISDGKLTSGFQKKRYYTPTIFCNKLPSPCHHHLCVGR